jgi:hypothetical protein
MQDCFRRKTRSSFLGDRGRQLQTESRQMVAETFNHDVAIFVLAGLKAGSTVDSSF